MVEVRVRLEGDLWGVDIRGYLKGESGSWKLLVVIRWYGWRVVVGV